MSARPFCNNLKRGDPVLDTQTGRKAKVVVDVGERSRYVCLQVDGIVGRQRRDVMTLRLIVDGKPEDCAPVDGEPPPIEERAPRRAPVMITNSALESLKLQRSQNAHAMAALELQYKALKIENEKLDRAIAVLEEKPKAA